MTDLHLALGFAGVIGFISVCIAIAWATLPSKNSGSGSGAWGKGLFTDKRSCSGCKNLPGKGTHNTFQFGSFEVTLQVQASGKLRFRDRFGPLLVIGSKEVLAVASWHSPENQPLKSRFSLNFFDFCYETCSCGWECIYFDPGKMMVLYIPWLRLIACKVISDSASRPIGGP